MGLTMKLVKRLRKIAADPETPPRRLAHLVNDWNTQVAQAAAANPSSPSDRVLEAMGDVIELYGDWLFVRLARTRNLSTDVMLAIIRHGTERCLWELVNDPSLPAHLMYEIIPRGSGRCLTMLQYHPNLPVDLMLKYIRGKGFACLCIIAENPNADITVLTAIYERVIGKRRSKWRRSILWTIAEHPACSLDLVMAIYGAGVWVPQGLISHPALPSDIIDQVFEWQQAILGYHASSTNRDEVEDRDEALEAARLIASHQNTSLRILTVLAMHPDPRLAGPALIQLRERHQANPALLDELRAISAEGPADTAGEAEPITGGGT